MDKESKINLKYRIRKIGTGVATIVVCSALAVTRPISCCASEGFGTEQTVSHETAEDEDRDETIRILKFRLLKALNVLRDAGLTPQAILEEVEGSHGAPESALEAGTTAAEGLQGPAGDMVGQLQESAGNAISDATEDIAQAAGDAASDAVDQATDAAKEKADEAIDSIGDRMRQSLQEFLDGIFHNNGGAS